MPRPTAILEISISEDAVKRLRAWFAAMYVGEALPCQVVQAIRQELLGNAE